MPPARIAPEEIAGYLPPDGLVWLSSATAASGLFRQGLAGRDLSALRFTGIFLPGLSRVGYLHEAGARVTTFFMAPDLAGANRLEFLPICYRDIGLWLARHQPRAVMVMLSPPDEAGMCSFGPVTDFVADLWAGAETIIAHINPRLPATNGPRIPFDRLTAWVEGPEELLEMDPGADEVSARIAAHAASVIRDGATLQAGIGRAPEAVLRGLAGKRDLAVHTGLIGDATLDLLEAGALRADNPITTGVAIGTRRLYDALGDERITFRPPSFTHDIRQLAAIENLVTINSAIEVDLTGAAYAEATPKGPISGPGGASDFAAGARGPGGLRLLVMSATAGRAAVSKIVRPGAATGPVSLGRFDTDMVITEHGVADLRQKSAEARRAALIAVAAPQHRATLSL